MGLYCIKQLETTFRQFCEKPLHITFKTKLETRMCANFQRDGHPVAYRWRPLFNATVWLTPTSRVPCSNAANTWNRLKLAGVPKLKKWSQPLVGRSSPYYRDMWRTYCCLTSFFPIVNTCLSCKDSAWQSLRWCPDGNFLRSFCILYFQWAVCSTFPTCILNSH